MSDTTSFPDDPVEAMAALGVQTDESAAPSLDGLAAIRATILADLEERQGPFRRAGLVGRYWPFALALVFSAFAFVLLKPADTSDLGRVLASVGAGLAGLTCLVAAACAPSRPGLGERLATVGVVLGIGSLIIEGVIASSMPTEHLDLGAPCAISMVAAAVLPMVALFFGLKRAGLPVRRRHAAGMAAAGMAMAGATVWMHCPANNAFHLFAGHIAIPFAISIGLSVGFFYLFAPRTSA